MVELALWEIEAELLAKMTTTLVGRIVLMTILVVPPASAGFTFTEVAPSLTSILSLRGGKEHDAEDAQFRDEAKRKDAGLDGSLANLKSLLDTLGERIKEKNQPAKLADDAPSAKAHAACTDAAARLVAAARGEAPPESLSASSGSTGVEGAVEKMSVAG